MEQGTMQMHTMQDPERYGMSKEEQTHVPVNQVYYAPPGTANAYGYNGMTMPGVAQPPPNMYSYTGMPMAEAALAPPPQHSSGWCTCCCGPCARWSRRCWIFVIILIVAIVVAVLVAVVVLTVAVQNGKDGQGYGG